ncbi:MAG: UvrD-helicase domain-containing protein [candidate division Zixibacteria bacterium]|nr:UvrD-helicase domain-containing protein [candidate division Zixibacteria bacterium]
MKDLNKHQKEAVCCLDGPLLVLAGAGTGKTKVITHRITHLIATHTARPDQVLGVTFTNKAAGEMKKRVIDLLGPVGRYVHLSTFHSFCVFLLRQHAETIGYKSSFTIYDEADSLALIKRICKSLNILDGQPSPSVAQHRISEAKSRLLTPAQFDGMTAGDYLAGQVSLIYRQYELELKKNNAVDFDDLLRLTVAMFEQNPQLLRYYQSRFSHVLVDEYQDTNYAQYRIVRLLTESHRNICVVGDDDQAIYGWRGADIKNILNFEEDFPGCRVITLDQNYRSTNIILDAAHGVVSKIGRRKPKKLYTRRNGGDSVTLLQCADDREEASAIAGLIKVGLQNGKKPTDFAILYRTNAQSRAIEDALRDSGIPYTIVGGTKFYERMEVKDILAYLRLLINPDDTQSLLRIVNVPKRGLGEVSIARLQQSAERYGKSPFALMATPELADIKGKPAIELKKLHAILTELSAKINELKPDELAIRLIEGIGYLKMLDEENSPEADVRADNVRELVSGIAAFMERKEEEEPETPITLAAFLEEVALITDIDTFKDEAAVVLMTVHAAKGLEFDTVFIAGMEEGLFPLIRDSSTDADLEEERRLCYVGITRAKNKLYLALSAFRRRYGNSFVTEPSRFLFDIDRNLIEVEKFGYLGEYNRLYRDRKTRTSTQIELPSVSRGSGNDAPMTYGIPVEANGESIKVGQKVSHKKFGTGTIIAREGSGATTMITVRFSGMVKKLMANHAALEILG